MALSTSFAQRCVDSARRRRAFLCFNPALYGAYGVYESLQVVNGVAVRAGRASRRLAHSAEILGLPLPADLADLRALDGRGRWLPTRPLHAAPVCGRRATTAARSRLSLAAAAPAIRADFYPRRLGHHFRGPPLPAPGQIAEHPGQLPGQRAARAAGVHEALLHHAGRLTEGSNSNLFAVVDGMVLTPPAAEVLSGVTPRPGASPWPRRRASRCMKRRCRWPICRAGQECFITSTSRHVMPVTGDRRPAGGRWPVGPLTRRVMGACSRLLLPHSGSVESGRRSVRPISMLISRIICFAVGTSCD